MKETIKLSFGFMTPAERSTYARLVATRSLASLLDLAGVLAIGFLAASVALFLTKGSDSHRRQAFLGLTLPSLTVQALPAFVGLILLLFIAKAVISALATRALARFIARVEARAARKIVENILGGDLDLAGSVSEERLYYLASWGVAAPFTQVLNYLATLISEGFLFIVLAVAFFVVDPISTLAVLVYFGIVGFSIQSLVGQRLTSVTRKVTEGLIRTQSIVGDIATSLRELTVAGKREVFFNRVEQGRLAVAGNVGEQLFYTSLPRYVLETAVLLGVFAFGAVKLLSGDLANSVSTIGVFLTGSFRIMAAMLPWQTALIAIKQSTSQAADVGQFLTANKKHAGVVARHSGNFPLPEAEAAELKACNLEYSFPSNDEFTIGPVDFGISPGSQVAFIGKSGSGKTTLVELIAGLRSPTGGSISIDECSPSELTERRPGSIAYVPQRPNVITGSVRENILLEAPPKNFDEERLRSAISLAKFEEVVALLPQGLDTVITSKNPKMSGGQLQRLGLARALYLKPRLLILDESTSGLDGHSELAISQTLASLRGRVTVVLVAHRLNTVQNADNIFLVDNGAIVDEGLLSELVSRHDSLAEAIEYSRVDGVDGK